MYRGINRRCACAFVLAAYLSGCTGWQTQRVTPQRVLEDSHYVRRGVRVTTADGRRLEIEHPTLRADTLTGTRDRAAVAIPLDQVRRLDVRRPSVPRTAALVVGSMAGAAAAALGVLCIYLCGATD